MARVVLPSGYGWLAPFGKCRVAASMFLKGKEFFGAILVSCQANSEHNDYVMLHLLCQGIEVSLKGLLLFSDYDKYIVRLVKPLGHNLLKIAVEASAATV